VQAHLEGDDASVEALITLLHRGPPSAKVEQIQVDEAELTNADGFEVRH
jgi:acylphosphatase